MATAKPQLTPMIARPYPGFCLCTMDARGKRSRFSHREVPGDFPIDLRKTISELAHHFAIPVLAFAPLGFLQQSFAVLLQYIQLAGGVYFRELSGSKPRREINRD